MSFIIRQITHTNDGREIIRATTVDRAEISIGRDAASDIHLQDLAVNLHHAKMVALGGGLMRVESVGGLAFEHDRRSVRFAEFNAENGAELGFGGHRLLVAAEGGHTVITVSRIAALSDAAEGRDAQHLFTLKDKLPTRRVSAWVLALGILILFLAWPIYTYATSHGVKDRGAGFHADTSWTAGPLSDAHKGLSNNCQACHVKKFEAVQDKACVACHIKVHEHADVHRQLLAKGVGEDAALKAAFGKADGRCVGCHAEHQSSGAMTPTPQKFCANCHDGLRARLPDTKLKDAKDFGTSHPDFGPWTKGEGLKFTHAQHLSRTNGVARMSQTLNLGKTLDCKDCHTPTADGTRFLPVNMEKNCQSCHSLGFENMGGIKRTLRHGEPDQVAADIRSFYRAGGPPVAMNSGGITRQQPGHYAASAGAQIHGWPGGAEGAVQRVFSKGGACYDCHSVSQSGGRYLIAKVIQPDHFFTKGWFNHAAHATESCGSCHAAATSQSLNEPLVPHIATCRLCHVGADGAALKSVSTPTRSTCAMCHDYHRVNEAPWRARRGLLNKRE